MAKFIVEVYELHMRKEEVDDVETAAEAIQAVFDGDGEVLDGSFELIEDADLYGMDAENDDNAELAGALQELGVRIKGHIPTIRDVYEIDPDTGERVPDDQPET